MNQFYQKRIKKRTVIAAFFSLLWSSAVVFRLVQLQIIHYPQLKARVSEQNRSISTISPKRGAIYDRRGSLMASSISCQSVFYTPFRDQPAEFQFKKILRLKRILGLTQEDLDLIKKRIKRNASFIWIERKIDSEKAEQVENLNLEGIYLTEENKRFYPQGKLAAQILGRVNIDEEGASGIEYKYNSLLAGKKGKRLILRDAKRRGYHFETLEAPEPGNDLTLTIDETIQYIAEKELAKVMQEKKAKWGTVIICQPSTGEILALANYPTFDLNNPPANPLKCDRIHGIHHLFDPGSTFKVIIAASAMETKSAALNEDFDCSQGSIVIAGKTFKDYRRLGILTFPEVIIHSSNVGAIQIGQRLGEKMVYNTIKAFGFGQKTGIDLPAEAEGIFRPLKSWSHLSLASLSIGYEISVTPIQMLQAINVIANRGCVTAPKMVKSIHPPSTDEPPRSLRCTRVISEQTASTLASILEKVVEKGTGKNARLQGYRIAGKTGTAQKFNPASGTYSSSSHTASFVGFVIAEKPIFSMMVVIDDPQGQYYGGLVAAPVFRKIAAQVLQYLKIPPQSPSETIIASKQWGLTDQ
ncbi:MAG: peptidoglycan D,D-transpeptidase FtsI family protein [Candidatus Aminicenantes bacterium]